MLNNMISGIDVLDGFDDLEEGLEVKLEVYFTDDGLATEIVTVESKKESDGATSNLDPVYIVKP